MSEPERACVLDDVEVCERGADIISTVDPFGNGQPHIEKEVYGDESHIAYYYCTNCTGSWATQDFGGDADKAWQATKEHFNV